MNIRKLYIFFAITLIASFSNPAQAKFDETKYMCESQRFVVGVSILHYFMLKDKSDLLQYVDMRFSKNEYSKIIRGTMINNADIIFDSFFIKRVPLKNFSEEKLNNAESSAYMECMMGRKPDIEYFLKIFE